MNYLITPYTIILTFALILGIYYALKGRKSTLPYFLPFLIFCFICEVPVNHYFGIKYQNNGKLISYYSFSCALFYLFQYYHHFSHKIWKSYLLSSIIIYIIFSIYILTTTQKDFEILPYLIGMGLTSILIFKYFYDIVYIDAYRSIRYEPLFYLSLGLITFIFTTYPIMLFFGELVMDQKKDESYTLIIRFGNIFISLAYLGVVLCSKKH